MLHKISLKINPFKEDLFEGQLPVCILNDIMFSRYILKVQNTSPYSTTSEVRKSTVLCLYFWEYRIYIVYSFPIQQWCQTPALKHYTTALQSLAFYFLEHTLVQYLADQQVPNTFIWRCIRRNTQIFVKLSLHNNVYPSCLVYKAGLYRALSNKIP